MSGERLRTFRSSSFNRVENSVDPDQIWFYCFQIRINLGSAKQRFRFPFRRTLDFNGFVCQLINPKIDSYAIIIGPFRGNEAASINV